MSDISSQTLQSLVDFCYTGEISISDVNVQSLLPAACLLQLNEIQVIGFVMQVIFIVEVKYVMYRTALALKC